MIRAAGILFIAPGEAGDVALLVRRGAGGDWPGAWAFPGGKQEPEDADLEATALREAKEEIGDFPGGSARLLCRRIQLPHEANLDYPSDEVDFSTFVVRVSETFIPTLNYEHDGYCWFPIESPPQPLHPGAAIALSRLTMTELDAAKAVAAGELTSPHQFENLALFALRITGTEAAYRRGLDEYVWRDPSIYLNDEFLARCNGLPVVIEHPDKATLDTKEYRDRVVGAIMLPYIKGDEVWGIARINDLDAAKVMEENQVSTSPAVVFRASEASNRTELENGSKLLIEGIPSLLDHLAICERGVWDKGGEPTGVKSDTIRGDTDMTDEEMKAKKDAEEKARCDAEERARKDAESGEKLDKMLSKLDAMEKRMDAFEKKEDPEEKKADAADPEEDEAKAVADKKRKDAEEEEKKTKEEEERKDRARKDSELLKANEEMLKKIAELAARVPPQLSDAERSAMADAQARADSVYALHGKQAPRPMDGEDLVAYRRRLANEMRPHSTAWKAVDLTKLPDEALAIAEGQIYADAERIGRSPPTDALGGLREVKRRDQTGREISEFVGDPREVFNPASLTKQYFKGMTPTPHH